MHGRLIAGNTLLFVYLGDIDTTASDAERTFIVRGQ